MHLGSIETPAVLLDLAKLAENLQSMQQLADQHGVVLRPHAKTHKSIEIARRQLALGAVGLTVATVGTVAISGWKPITTLLLSWPSEIIHTVGLAMEIMGLGESATAGPPRTW